VGSPVSIVVTNRLSTCSATLATAFQYQLACVSNTPTPTATATPTPTTTPLPGADLAVSKVDTPDPVSTGGDITWTITVTNNGPGTATNVTVNDLLPNGTTFVSCAASLGSCSGPNVGQNGPVAVTGIGNLGPLGGVTITLVANVTAGPGTIISNTATATSGTADPVPGNNSGTASTTVGP
jgi:uncharacterized repeat protein (TIGR01451 family)